MSVLSFVLLAHERAEHVAEVAACIASSDPGCFVVIHYDANASADEFEKLRALCAGFPQIRFVEKRVRCGWGEFGLVEGVVNSLRLIEEQGLDCTHVYLASGSCLPTRPLAELRQFLDQHPDTEFIEAFDKNWITGGLREARYQFRFKYNFQKQRRRFEASYWLQRKFGRKRKFPKGLEARFGSQWWCLTRKTCDEILAWIDANGKDYEFFRWTWIPDECFFQTLVYRLAGANRIAPRILTHYQFNSVGKPVVYHEGHEDYLKSLDCFFARKVSHYARVLRAEFRHIAARPAAETGTAAVGLHQRAGKAVHTALPVMFEDGRIHRDWSSMDRKSMQSFAVLYGPPEITRRAASALERNKGLDVFGRLFRPGMVDFGPQRHSFGGLRAEDAAIRDMDPSLFLSRVLDRCTGFPVFELCPGDDKHLEGFAPDFERAIFLPLLPAPRSPYLMRLFWALCLTQWDRIHSELEFSLETEPREHAYLRALNGGLAREIGRDHIDWMNRLLVGGQAVAGTHYWGDQRDPEISSDWIAGMRFLHGATVDHLILALPELRQSLDRIGMDGSLALLPDEWQEFFSPLVAPFSGGRTGLLRIGSAM